MVKDGQVRMLMRLMNREKTLEAAAAKAGMTDKTARKYQRLGKLPSQCRVVHDWKTREDAFAEDWPWAQELLENHPGLEAKALFAALQRERPGQYQDSQLRTFQRRVKRWRAWAGPAKEIFFAQVYEPGQWCESDFTHMESLGVTIGGVPFPHLLYHFVLCWSNWETGTVCFSESYESLSQGLQNALWKLGGVPLCHRTDHLTSAVNQIGNPETFTAHYRGLANHYGFVSGKIQPRSPQENGDVEQRHYRLKNAVDQALMLRGRRDFVSRPEYERFLEEMFEQLDAGRQERLREELKVLRRLPARRHEDFREVECRVGIFGTIRVLKNTYSLHSRLAGERVKARIYAEQIEVWYAQRQIEVLPRLRGENGHWINYRHVIDRLVRKPGAFENYRYKDDLFPTSQFRIAYDLLREQAGPKQGNQQYLKLLELAAHENETLVNETLRFFIRQAGPIDVRVVEERVKARLRPPAVTEVEIAPVDLRMYDQLLEYQEALVL
jgi:Mu transposase, C-terminal domain